MSTFETRTAWELIGYDGDAMLRIKGGRAFYETAIFYDVTRQKQVKLARVDVDARGLRQVNRYVDPDTEIELVPQCDCLTEPAVGTGWECVVTHSADCHLHPDHAG